MPRRLLYLALALLVAACSGSGGPFGIDDDDGGSVSGKTATFEDLSVTLIQSGDWEPGPDDLPVEPEAGNRFFTIEVRYVNASGGQRSFNLFDFEIETSADTRVDPVPSWRDPSLDHGNLAAGDEVVGWVTFEIPVGQTAERLLYSPRFDVTLAIPI